MSAFFQPPPFLSYPLSRAHHFTSSSQPPPPPTPPPQPPQTPTPTPLSSSSELPTPTQPRAPQQKPNRPAPSAPASADSTDWIASTLTRRFGLGAGLAWAAFLAVGVVSEQIKTRLEVSQQEANARDVAYEQEVVLPNGIRYYELRVGGGASPRQGDLVVIDLRGNVEGTGEEFVNTFSGDRKPLALVMGSRPYTRGMCEGVEYVLRSMKAGGKRRVMVPPGLGFGEKGADLGAGVQVPPLATLEYVVEIQKVSIAPT